MTDLRKAKDIIGSLFFNDKAITQRQYEILRDVLDSILPRNPHTLRELAEDLWEGCDGCDDNDKEFWISGFTSGYNFCKSTGDYIKTKKDDKD